MGRTVESFCDPDGVYYVKEEEEIILGYRKGEKEFLLEFCMPMKQKLEAQWDIL